MSVTVLTEEEQAAIADADSVSRETVAEASVDVAEVQAAAAVELAQIEADTALAMQAAAIDAVQDETIETLRTELDQWRMKAMDQAAQIAAQEATISEMLLTLETLAAQLPQSLPLESAESDPTQASPEEINPPQAPEPPPEPERKKRTSRWI